LIGVKQVAKAGSRPNALSLRGAGSGTIPGRAIGVRPRFLSHNLFGIANFPLVADSEDADQILYRDVSVERNVARAAEGNHQLANLAFDTTADEWVMAQQ